MSRTREETKARRKRRNILAGCAAVLLIALMVALTANAEDAHSVDEPVENQIEVANLIMPVENEQIEDPVEQIETAYLGKFRVTAYCSCRRCCGVWSENRPVDENGNEIVYGAAGVPLEAGRSVAVDPLVIPYGTVLLVDGVEYTAEDCGGAIKGNRLDVYFDSHEAACEWGVQFCEVEMICGRSDSDDNAERENS